MGAVHFWTYSIHTQTISSQNWNKSKPGLWKNMTTPLDTLLLQINNNTSK
jgi:hypothetical protein